MAAPPHPRGSTPGNVPEGEARGGSPASAGIDPTRTGCRTWPRRLPRIRGDRPGSYMEVEVRREAPPHPRGSTPDVAALAGGPAGSPASAGIDPPACDPRPCGSWLPRIRGDRPAMNVGNPGALPAPPHPRGSTHAALLDARGDVDRAPPHPRGSTHEIPRDPRGARLRGSPASAGIDPSFVSHGAATGGLPRIRGDRPTAFKEQGTSVTAPPHPRGSTRGLDPRRAAAAGSPASAGIDPTVSISSTTRARLPRIRGDRPEVVVPRLGQHLAPPHPRGSTREHPHPLRQRDGSPASAGIDPIQSGWR